MNDVDLWDDAGPFLYQHLPEDSLSAFFTEERDMIQITSEKDGYWLSDTRSQGASRYDTMSDAKAAGDEQIAASLAKQDETLLAEASMSASAWKVSYADGLRFEQKEGPFWIVASGDGISTRQAWDLYRGDEQVIADARDIAPLVATADARR